jgi:hypothetical protein
MTKFVVTATELLPSAGEIADLPGATARTGPEAGRIAKTIPISATKVQVFAEISLMGGKTTPKGEVSSRHVRGTA